MANYTGTYIMLIFVVCINYYREVKLPSISQNEENTLKSLVFWREQTIPVSDKSVCVHIPVIMAIVDGLTT